MSELLAKLNERRFKIDGEPTSHFENSPAIDAKPGGSTPHSGPAGMRGMPAPTLPPSTGSAKDFLAGMWNRRVAIEGEARAREALSEAPDGSRALLRSVSDLTETTVPGRLVRTRTDLRSVFDLAATFGQRTTRKSLSGSVPPTGGSASKVSFKSRTNSVHPTGLSLMSVDNLDARPVVETDGDDLLDEAGSIVLSARESAPASARGSSLSKVEPIAVPDAAECSNPAAEGLGATREQEDQEDASEQEEEDGEDVEDELDQEAEQSVRQRSGQQHADEQEREGAAGGIPDVEEGGPVGSACMPPTRSDGCPERISSVKVQGNRITWLVGLVGPEPMPEVLESAKFNMGEYEGAYFQLRLKLPASGDALGSAALSLHGELPRPPGMRVGLFAGKGWVKRPPVPWPDGINLEQVFDVKMVGRSTLLCGLLFQQRGERGGASNRLTPRGSMRTPRGNRGRRQRSSRPGGRNSAAAAMAAGDHRNQQMVMGAAGMALAPETPAYMGGQGNRQHGMVNAGRMHGGHSSTMIGGAGPCVHQTAPAGSLLINPYGAAVGPAGVAMGGHYSPMGTMAGTLSSGLGSPYGQATMVSACCGPQMLAGAAYPTPR